MPPGEARESSEAFKLQAIISTALLVGNSGFPFMVLFFSIGHPKEALVILWSWLLFMAIPWFAKKRMHPTLLAHLLAANYYQCHLFLCLLWGGIDAPNLMWFAAMPIVSMLVGSVIHGVVWGAITALSVLAIYLLERADILELTSSLDAGERLFVLATGSVGLLAAVLGSTAAFELLRLAAIRRRQGAEDELRSANEDLKTREHELQTSYDKVEALLVEVQAADKAKSRFLAQVSHELRTPLNGILGTSEAIQTGIYGELSGEQRGALTALDRSANHQLALINDLLDFARIEKEGFEPVMETIRPFELITEVSEMLKEKAKAAGLEYGVHPGHESLEITSDTRRVRQMLLNLVGNAIKFTPAGGSVWIALKVEGGKVVLEVRDTGIGIASDVLPKIFDAFTQIDSVLQREHEGSGLGLSLTANLAEALGGEIKVRSELGKGSTFSVLLPYRLVESFEVDEDNRTPARRKAPTAEAEQSPGKSEGLHVLLVDDTEANITHLRDFLMVKGHRVSTAANGLEAVEAAQARPDVIFMDVQMPKMDGLEAIRRLRADPHTSDLFIVSLTSFAMEEDRAKCLEAGADDYASKPVSLKRVLEFVERQR